MEQLHEIPIAAISPNPYQPRITFQAEQLEELAQSIKENGIIQPLIVRKSKLVGYELLAGERRLRASQLAGLETVPVIVKELTDEELAYQAIIENLQRSDLNPIEEALSYQKLLDKGITHDELAKKIGKSRPYISNTVRLLQLSTPLQKAVETGQISQGHARLLIGKSAKQQEAWLTAILQKEMSVRQLEQALKQQQKQPTEQKKDVFLAEEEEKLRQLLGCPVHIEQKTNGSGNITLSFQNLEEFERIIHNLN